jgi:hypothetical protein
VALSTVFKESGMVLELLRLWCPHCQREVEAVRPQPLEWYLISPLGYWLANSLRIGRPAWQCRQCGLRIREPAHHAVTLRILLLIAMVLLLMAAVVLAAALWKG